MSRLFACEGIDGSGKSTLARVLATALGATLTSEPTRGPHGTALRQAFAAGKRLSLTEERRLFELDRRDHMTTVVRPQLAQGACLVSDRTYFSSAAYQGASVEDGRSLPRRRALAHAANHRRAAAGVGSGRTGSTR
jgi:dTMP kinase